MNIDFRLQALRKLEQELAARMPQIHEALKQDLGKAEQESYMCETGLSLSELRYVMRHLRLWSREKRVPTPLAQYTAKSFTVQEPYGVTLILSPWNYPVLLTLDPLVGAIAAGNCCIVKPSAYSPAVSAVLRELISACFPEEYVAVVEGGRAENAELLDQKFDYIFFTGGVKVGKLVMEKASASLTPVTLELGGKSPCIIEKTAKLRLAAKRLVWGKYLNLGQTCVAPDYVLCEESVREEFVGHVKYWIREMFGEDPFTNPDYGKMINEKHYHRVMGLIDPAKTVIGGDGDEGSLKIAPTVMDGVTPEDPVMQEEIFGPVMPILSIRDMDEAFDFVRSRPEPLALYIFTQDPAVEKRFLSGCKFGGGCVNDTIIHLATSAMGFGGVGNSGMGSYHGKKSFQTFSHEKSIVKKYTWMDLPMRYQPFTRLHDRMVRMFIR